jgi:predicted nucleic acid-binding protein
VTYILDTNVISELVRQKPNPNVVAWVNVLIDHQAYLSVITLSEINKGIERLEDSDRKRTLSKWLHTDLLARFHGRILSLDREILLAWGKLTADLEKKGQTMPAIDSLIAATALQHGFIIATRNEGDFENAGIKTLNPWLT